MASSDDPLLRLQRTAYMTPRRRSPSIVDAVDRPREQTTPFSPESIYPTPPGSSPWQACHQTESATISRPAPLKLLGGERNAVPQTPQRRVDVGIHSSFTPFHDIKQDIDKLIGELPTGFEDLVKSKEETVVERSEIRNGKHLSLFLYSPSKKKPLEPTKEDVFGSGEGFELIGEETLALPCVNSSAPTDLAHQQQPLNRSLLSKASCVFKKTIKFIVPRGLHRLSRGNTLREMRLGGEEEAEAEEEAPRPIQLPPKKKARSIPMRNPPPGCCHHSQQQTLPTSTPGASNSILLLPIMSNNSISSPPQRRRRRQEQQQQPQQPQPQQPKSSIRRKPVPKVPPPKYPAAATTPHHVATTTRGRRRSTILRIHNVPSYIVHQDDFFHPPPHHHPHRFSPPESKINSSSSNRIQSLHASIYDFDIDDPMMPDHHHHHQEEKHQQQKAQKAQKGQKIPPQIPLSQTPLYVQAAASLCIMAIAAGADFLVEDDSSYGYSWGVGRKMGSWTCSSRRRRRVG